eukprot:COSAG02_NODE_4914_length_4839_cov_2552.799367_2_plen_147_part_00
MVLLGSEQVPPTDVCRRHAADVLAQRAAASERACEHLLHPGLLDSAPLGRRGDRAERAEGDPPGHRCDDWGGRTAAAADLWRDERSHAHEEPRVWAAAAVHHFCAGLHRSHACGDGNRATRAHLQLDPLLDARLGLRILSSRETAL